MKFIVITGPESSGKTTLSNQLSTHFNYPLIDEYARTYLNTIDRSYIESDLEHIAEYQIDIDNKINNLPTILDTDLLTTYIWLEEVFEKCQLDWLKHLSINTEKIYLLCKPDIPWTYDPQRENPHDRQRLYEKYKYYLDFLNLNYIEIFGEEETRLQMAIDELRTRDMNYE
jgi:nicotinamide riboside kinase